MIARVASQDRASNAVISGRRPLVISLMLGAALVLIGVLGWQSWRLHSANAATADAVLRDYGTLVADELGRRATAALGYRGFYALVTRLAGVHDPREMRATVASDAALQQAAGLVDEFFRLNGGRLDTESSQPPARLEAVLRKIGASAVPGDSPYFSARSDDGVLQVIYTVREGGNSEALITGFTVNRAGMGDLLRMLYESEPLLPQSLAQGRVSNDLLFLRVTDPARTVLFEANTEFDSRLTVERVLGSDYQAILEGFRIEVSLDPGTAPELIIGGLPASRLPLLVGVMALVVALMVAAIWLYRREQAVMQLRADFVAQVSHELRTPLTQLRMFSETLLLDRAQNEKDRRRSLEIINREAQRLSHLADNILSFSRNGNPSGLDLREQLVLPVVTEVCRLAQANAGAVSIRVAGAPDVHALVDVDALRQVLLNLLDNALKYGPEEQEIQVAVEDAGNTTLVSVEDEGPGIPEGERERVWQPFYRLRREEETAISGTGIGLAVVRERVESMGGRCWVEPGRRGTRVCLEFVNGNEGDGPG